ncbi:hypothetical protein [Pelomonas sp. Root1444]|uniref:hypothetical protein n=1 Tax=Pelomonas sp. Root1444 TaxID=1736464 RepID=UPI0012FAE82C|nr:hypothetical protein [Pelomonas sp. Root1444]
MIGVALVLAVGMVCFWLEIGIAQGRVNRVQDGKADSLASSAFRSSSVVQPDVRTALITAPEAREAAVRPFDRLAQTALEAELRLGVNTRRLMMAPSHQAADGAGFTTVVSFELQGPYPGVKAWMAGMLTTWPQALAFKSLDLTRIESDAPAVQGVLARVEFLFTPGANPK